MRVLVVGLGSMGKRRLRCLEALGFAASSLTGFDLREDRRSQAAVLHPGSAFYGDLDEAVRAHEPEALIISVPPDVHHLYIRRAIEGRRPFFVEASVVDDGLEEFKMVCNQNGLLAAPSATLCFHAGVKLVFETVRSGVLGRISNILYHSGQYLPDWHVYEPVSAYYVSNPLTGGAREIVPFELTWLTALFGFPGRVCGYYRKTITIEGAEKIDDTYNALLDYGDFLMNLSVDVVSRIAVRRLLINGDKGQLRWDWDENAISLYEAASGRWSRLPYCSGQAHDGYNVNIGEAMYIDEMKTFIQAVRGEAHFPNTLENDHQVLKLLYALEESDRNSTIVHIPFAGKRVI